MRTPTSFWTLGKLRKDRLAVNISVPAIVPYASTIVVKRKQQSTIIIITLKKYHFVFDKNRTRFFILKPLTAVRIVRHSI